MSVTLKSQGQSLGSKANVACCFDMQCLTQSLAHIRVSNGCWCPYPLTMLLFLSLLVCPQVYFNHLKNEPHLPLFLSQLILSNDQKD